MSATNLRPWKRPPLDLIRLDRYEREAWSLQKRAIFAFMNIKLMKAMPVPHDGSVSAGQTFPRLKQ
jgi:hypothetical protein